jgi:hypothetical protein
MRLALIGILLALGLAAPADAKDVVVYVSARTSAASRPTARSGSG